MQTRCTIHSKQNPYPYLAVHKDDLDRDDPMIVMFIREDYGILISTNSESDQPIGRVGEYLEYSFTQYNGTITLSN